MPPLCTSHVPGVAWEVASSLEHVRPVPPHLQPSSSRCCHACSPPSPELCRQLCWLLHRPLRTIRQWSPRRTLGGMSSPPSTAEPSEERRNTHDNKGELAYPATPPPSLPTLPNPAPLGGGHRLPPLGPVGLPPPPCLGGVHPIEGKLPHTSLPFNAALAVRGSQLHLGPPSGAT
jgi:hypothetical protein